MNQMRLRGKVVFIGKAKYRRASDVRDTNKVQPRENNRIVTDLQRPPEREANQKTSTVSTKELAKEKTVQDPHENGWTKKVREIGAYKSLLTFELNAKETYTFKMNSLLQLFHSVWRWDESEKSETRRVWLECFGVLLHACSFSVGEVQIDTCVMEVINEWVHITIGASGFDVLVKEVGRETYEEKCKLETMEEEAVRCEQHKISFARDSDDVAIWLKRTANSTNYPDQAVEVVMEGWRDEVEDEARLVNSEIILNEWSYEDEDEN
ncbi:hypothetical protein AHAS_Ahas05G0044000 [Arachis hypogaea]